MLTIGLVVPSQTTRKHLKRARTRELVPGRLPKQQPSGDDSSRPFIPRGHRRLSSHRLSTPCWLGRDEIEYLQKKGAFNLSETSLQNEFLRCSVQCVHPICLGRRTGTSGRDQDDRADAGDQSPPILDGRVCRRRVRRSTTLDRTWRPQIVQSALLMTSWN